MGDYDPNDPLSATRPRVVFPEVYGTSSGHSTLTSILGAIGQGLQTFTTIYTNRNNPQIAPLTPQQQLALQQAQAQQQYGIQSQPGYLNIFGTQISYGTLAIAGLALVLIQSRPFSRR